MNSLARILAAVRFEPTDRVPFVPQVFGLAGQAAGIGLDAYVRDGRVIAECQLALQRRLGHDAVFAFTDLGVEAEALGARLRYYARQYPEIATQVLTPDGDVAALQLPDPARDGRMPETLRALGLLRRALGDDVMVVGGVAGPMTLASQLCGAENLLYLTADDPARVVAVLDFATALASRFGAAQLDAGAHMVTVLDPMASPAVVPPEFFGRLLLPRLRRLMRGLRQAGAAATWLNIAGPTAPNLPRYAELDADIATFDYYVAADEARRLLPRTCAVGNLKSLDFVVVAPDELSAAGRRLVDAFADRGGFILASGCEIPPEAGIDGIAALARMVAGG